MPVSKKQYSIKKKQRTNITKKRSIKNAIQDKLIKGGAIYGNPGAYGVIVGDPPIPGKDFVKLSRLSKFGQTLKSKLYQDDKKYVSKLFFDEQNLPNALSAIQFLKVAAGNLSIEQVFGDYLSLPRKWPNGEYYVDINRKEFMKPTYQYDGYWKLKNPKNIDEQTPNLELRDKLYNSTQQIQYSKATCGDLNSIKLNTYKSLCKFITRFRNIIEGIDLLHEKGLIHHDIKPANLLCTSRDGHTTYIISDLDSIRHINDFIPQYYNSTDNFHITRLLYTWAYEFFPTCITLIQPLIIDPSLTNIQSSQVNILISKGLANQWNQESANGCMVLFKNLFNLLEAILPSNDEVFSQLHEIFMNKYGSLEFEVDFKDSTNPSNPSNINVSKYKKINDTNKVIATYINQSGMSSIEIRNMLLKYVDIYSTGMSILNILQNFMIINQSLEDYQIIYIKTIFKWIHSILTTKYFEDRLYENTFIGLYNQILP